MCKLGLAIICRLHFTQSELHITESVIPEASCGGAGGGRAAFRPKQSPISGLGWEEGFQAEAVSRLWTLPEVTVDY